MGIKDTIANKAAEKLKNVAGDKVSESQSETVHKATKAATTVSTISSGFSAATSAISSTLSAIAAAALPLLIALLATIAVIMLVALMFLVGRTENADGCFGIGSTSSNSSSSSSANIQNGKSGKDNAKNIAEWATTTKFKFLGDKPMTKEQVAGILGNWAIESHIDPTSAQPGGTSKASNDEIIKMGSADGLARGIAQWDATRRTDLAQFAKSQGKNWYDLDLQMTFFQKELDEGFHGKALAAGGFTDTGKSPAYYAERFNRIYEGSSDYSPTRGEEAEKIFKGDLSDIKSSGGGDSGSSYSSKSGGSCKMNDTSDGNADYDSIVKLAVSIAYPAKEADKAAVSPGDANGTQNATQAYKEAKKKAQDKGGADPQPDLYSSCDRFVATVLKNTVDKDIPWGSTTEQEAYFQKNSDKWEKFTKKSQAKPGDVFITKTNGHVMLYVGDVEGVDSLAMASYTTHVGYILDSNYISEDLVDQQGRPYWGFHYKG